MMTISEFLDRLYETPRDWQIGRDGAITRYDGSTTDCPWQAVGSQLVVNLAVTQAIWRAADNAPGHKRAIRRALLHACGIGGQG